MKDSDRVLLLGCGQSLETFEWPAEKVDVVCGVNDSWKKSMENGRRLDLHVFGDQRHAVELRLHNPGFVYDFSEKGELLSSPGSGVTGRVLHRLDYPKHSSRPGFSYNLASVYPGGSLFVALQVVYNLGFRRVAIAGLDWKGAHFYDPTRPIHQGIVQRQRPEFEVARDVLGFEVVNLNPDSACRVFPFGSWP